MQGVCDLALSPRCGERLTQTWECQAGALHLRQLPLLSRDTHVLACVVSITALCLPIEMLYIYIYTYIYIYIYMHQQLC